MTDPAIGALTPSQTAGPFLHMVLPWPDGPDVVPPDTADAVVIHGRVYDGTGAVVADALVETWQADPDGGFAHPDDPRGVGRYPDFRGFGRCETDAAGEWHIRTRKPGPLPTPDGRTEAPHLDVSVFARGLLDRLVTRLYFADEPDANAADPVLSTVDPQRRATLVAVADEGGYRLDIRLQGADETVFFDV
jgi:protocatechuate 3,4-dioxygenase alpha subunit